MVNEFNTRPIVDLLILIKYTCRFPQVTVTLLGGVWKDYSVGLKSAVLKAKLSYSTGSHYICLKLFYLQRNFCYFSLMTFLDLILRCVVMSRKKCLIARKYENDNKAIDNIIAIIQVVQMLDQVLAHQLPYYKQLRLTLSWDTSQI